MAARSMFGLLCRLGQTRLPQEFDEFDADGVGDHLELRERGRDAPLLPSGDGAWMDPHALRQFLLRETGALPPVGHPGRYLFGHDLQLPDPQLRVKQDCAPCMQPWV